MFDRYRAKPGKSVDLKDRDPGDTAGFKGGKEKALEKIEELAEELNRLQEILYAEHKRSFLIILQGMDTSGKDGVVRHVFSRVSPHNVRVADFKKPTWVEAGHDFLWRIHPHAPTQGEMVIFNRSHYEDVLVPWVHNLVPEKMLEKRYKHIVHFEKTLADQGTVILKFFLHISKEEQKKRLLARVKDPTKRWKFNPDDLKERAFWHEYRKAYEKAIEETSTDLAPWYIVPSNHKWFRNLLVASVIVETLQGLKLKYPKIRFNPSQVRIK